ncbi:s-adenosyl-l-methionine-dependent methyltransferase [Lucifera butyrica]|uniref:S-adenosyl-l-methionine-dependent methyltransferase n=1 Tax=Lucifera butyrica TaxID=1351585 RepID=A0A498R900_9FIRM|nr:s-adenosyl-l-methionine-dependent methyltransferase [Lucifera butyrica]
MDVVLTKLGLAPSRERAKACIMAGKVLVDGQRVDKAGHMVAADAKVILTGDSIGYVSRGGLKLAKALQYFAISLEEKVMLDVGASTGGFTDCALKNGAKRVYAVDVGYGQLAWSLRNDSRVVNMERTNIREVTPADIDDNVDFITVDVAFISLVKVLPVLKNILQPQGHIIALIKPQFEAGREKVGKKGVVREPSVHIEVIQKVTASARSFAFTPIGLTFSPVKGPEGNIEYLLYLLNDNAEDRLSDALIEAVVQEAHAALKE